MNIEIASKLYRGGRFDEAERACRILLGLDPNDAPALSLLGLSLHRQGRSDEGMQMARRAVGLRPDAPDLLRNLAYILGNYGQHTEAASLLERSLQLSPADPHALHNLGVAHERAGQFAPAERAYRETIALEPGYAEAYCSLGNLLRQSVRIEEAVQCYNRVIALRPDLADAHCGLAAARWVQGDQPAVIEAYRNALRAAPRRSRIHSALIFAMFHEPAYSPADRLREAVAWDEMHAKPLAGAIAPHRNERDPNRRLRIGYLSPDFVEHPCCRNALPIIRSHDRAAFEVFCYADLQRPDAMTQRVREAADGWRDITRLSDEQAANAIREDGIDILVDLAGHMGRSRLAIFARKPAPIQIQLTYPGTTGLATMDYRITDAVCDPPGIGEQQHTERLIRLPCAWCYEPGDLPPVGRLPALRQGGAVTFGCLNRPMKITVGAVEAWAAILRRLPGSRMILLSGTTHGRNDHLATLLRLHGLDERRIRLVPRVTRARYLELFNEIDIALDPFPYNGDATTLDGLWMGVPLITLTGDSFVSRRGASHLTSVGLEDLVARDIPSYVQIAVDLGRDLQRLAAVRASLRERMHASPSGNALRYTRNLEAAMRLAWVGRADG